MNVKLIRKHRRELKACIKFNSNIWTDKCLESSPKFNVQENHYHYKKSWCALNSEWYWDYNEYTLLTNDSTKIYFR